MANPAENFAMAAITRANQDKRVRPWKDYNVGHPGNRSVEWVKTGGKVNVLSNAFQI
jgi:hypothetical protein